MHVVALLSPFEEGELPLHNERKLRILLILEGHDSFPDIIQC